MRVGAGLEPVFDQPAIGIEPLDDAGAAQGLQPADMALDIGVIVPTGDPNSACLGDSPVMPVPAAISAILRSAGRGVEGACPISTMAPIRASSAMLVPPNAK